MSLDPGGAATTIQRKASRPEASALLRASAGSGKTKVLVDRLLKLMISGAPLKSVVAMTFTRKAAVEIKARLLKRVAKLARSDASSREIDLTELLGRTPSGSESSRASTLFEEILEDVAGLHIGTIHTFCQMLLSRFADEAGIDPGFGIIERTDDLWEEALERLERETGADADRTEGYADIGRNPPGARKRLHTVLEARMEIDRWLDRAARESGLEDRPRKAGDLLTLLRDDLARSLFAGTVIAGVEPELSLLASPLAAAAREMAGPGIDSVVAAEGADASNAFVRNMAVMRAELLSAADRFSSRPVPDVLPDLSNILLTRDGKIRKPRGHDCTKAERLAAFSDAALPLIDLLRLARLVRLYAENVTLLTAGLRALDIFADLKTRDRCLDFHDLERRAWELLQDFEVGMWVVYRLDDKLDHLLVDEFQDTNRNQWDVMKPFVDEFVSAQSPDGVPRTVFFVGDVKQSIYGFRGACPELFGQVADDLRRRAEVDPLTLPTNFRSLPAVVGAVGDLFEADPLCGLLPDDAERDSVRQIPWREDGPGEVTVLPPVADEEDGPDGQEICAAMAVRIIKRILAEKRVGREGGGDRAANYGDILMLSRNRTHLDVYVKALREAGIPFVPPGRGALARSREVADIRLLLRWLIFPQDDPALATVLRSPLMRVDERRLQSLLAARKGTLWLTLAGTGKSPGRAAELGLERETGLLSEWRRHIGRETSHALLRRIYRDSDALDSYHLALGEQARYNLLRLHDLALTHDMGSFPSPRRFLDAIEQAALRQDEEEASLPESDRGRVKIMTIHGAKGLEAPFVLLVDAASPMSREDPDRIDLGGGGDGPLLFGVRKEHRDVDEGNETAVSLAATAAVTRTRREEANLLYVALTRARDEIFVLGAEPTRSLIKPSYLKWIAEARGGCDKVPDWLADASGDVGAANRIPGVAEKGDTVRYESWDPVGNTESVRLCIPSAASGKSHHYHDGATRLAAEESASAEAAAGEREPIRKPVREAADRGTRIHLWLQRAAESGSMPTGDTEEWAEARAVFENPGLDWIFRPGTARGFCEIPFIHRNVSSEGDVSNERMLGVIDRLLVTDDEVIIIDYKSNRVDPAETPRLVEHYRPQLAAYREGLAGIFPGRAVSTWLLFTHVRGPAGTGLPIKVSDSDHGAQGA